MAAKCIRWFGFRRLIVLLFSGGSYQQRNKCKGKLDAQHDLTEDQNAKRVHGQKNDHERRYGRNKNGNSVEQCPRVFRFSQEPGDHIDLRHGRRHGRADTREDEGNGEQEAGKRPGQRLQRRRRLLDAVDHDVMAGEDGGRHDDHRRVHHPPQEHGKKRIDLLVAQEGHFLVLGDAPLPAVNDVGMQEDIVRHHHRSKDGHGHVNAASVDARNDHRGRQFRPVGLDDQDLHEVAQADDPQKAHDDRLDPVIPLADDEKHFKEYREQSARPQRHAEEEIESDGPSEQFRHIGRDTRQDNRQPQKRRYRTREAFPDVDRKGLSGGNAELGGHVLDHNQHDRAERNDPEKFIAELRSALDIRGPVAGIDEPDRDKETGPKKAEKRLEREFFLGCCHSGHSSVLAGHPGLHNGQGNTLADDLAVKTVIADFLVEESIIRVWISSPP